MVSISGRAVSISDRSEKYSWRSENVRVRVVENSAAGGYLDASHLKVVLKKDFTLKDKQTDRRDVTDGHDVTDGCDRNTLQDNFKNCDKQSQ